MTNPVTHSWADTNQRYLMAAMAVVRVQLERSCDTGAVPRGDVAIRAAREAAHAAQQELERPAPLDILCRTFDLSIFERELLLLCAGVELDKEIGALCSMLQGDPTPTFGLALRVLEHAEWGALTPEAPLRRWLMVDLGPGNTLTTRRLRIDEFVLHYLLGLPTMDERMNDLFIPVESPSTLPPSQEILSQRIVESWSSTGSPRALCLCSAVPATVRAVAAHACALMGYRMYAGNAADLPEAATELALLARLWERHGALGGAMLVLEISSEAGRARAISFAQRLRGPILLAAAEPIFLSSRTVMRIDIDKPRPDEQRILWQQALGPLGENLGEHIERIATQFHFSTHDITAVAAHLDTDAASGHDPAELLWAACRSQARPRLEELAQAIEPHACWEDLVLGERQQRMLREVAIHVRQRARVYQTWGFADKSARGLGISALFAGPSGTGKTTAAEVLARELELDLYRIDLSSVVSKYIGETEKNLRRVFDAADDGGAILLFDEADALFGKRSEVKDSHDRYANMEVSYLLQRMEAYRGLAILTTNLRDAMDTAFLRRIRFVVEFTFPTMEQRATIWTRMFPASAPTHALDFGKLARLNLAGGSIRNVALGGAFLAAQEGVSIQMRHLQEAARSELAKQERPIPERELKDWT